MKGRKLTLEQVVDAMDKETKVNTCKNCKKDYDRAETKRVFGDMIWIGTYCSARCYTDATMAEMAAKKETTGRGIPELNEIIGPNQAERVGEILGTEMDESVAVAVGEFKEHFEALLAKGPVRFRGLCYSYTFDPTNWKKVEVSDGAEIELNFASDLADWAPEFLEVITDAGQHVESGNLTTGRVDQATYEGDMIENPPYYELT